jgi:hypothetical protein
VTFEHNARPAETTIRTRPFGWLPMLVAAAALLADAALLAPDRSGPMSPHFFFVSLGCLMAIEALWLRTRGIDLTPEFAVVRGFRRRSIPWSDVQAVLYRRRKFNTWDVQLILASGKPVALRAPTKWLGFGVARYDRDFHRIGQWWLAHRVDSWTPAPPQA